MSAAEAVDFSRGFAARAVERLRPARIIWLVTVRSDGLPQPVPVWFLWDGQSFLIYSRDHQQKLRNIRRNPQVALHLDSDGRGGNITVFSGRAELATETPPAHEVPDYLERYRDLIARNSWSPEEFAQLYSIAIRVTPTGVTGH